VSIVKRRLQASTAEEDGLRKKKVAESEKTVQIAAAAAQKEVAAPAEAKEPKEPSSLFADYDSD
jgi:hypothetical protein